MIIILRNLSIAILIWMIIFFLHGFFRELYKILRERYEDWRYMKEFYREIRKKLIKGGLLERDNRKKRG